ncbi:hypothetical protein AAHZ94_06480 [Streptomyces sp. HSW2009]|uniref:hypothetical protein n=1 Tax=Streptomyces sp. HSW2009 TaxID=3142890 RepID=UPI0032ECE02A
MICPHCKVSIRFRERTGGTCARCREPFALDPRLHGKGMHDLRILRRAKEVTQDGRLQVTLHQFWYLARSANPYRGWIEARHTRTVTGWLVALPLSAGLVAVAFLVPFPPAVSYWPHLLVSAMLLRWAAHRRDDDHPRIPPKADITPDEYTFRRLLTDHWVKQYEGLPPGIIDEREYADPAHVPTEPVAVLLSPGRAVSVFLTANGIVQRLAVHLATTLDDLPPDVPVIVLHDASATDVLRVAVVREALPDRVVIDAGLSARVAHGRQLVRLVKPTEVSARQLRSEVGMDGELATWLADGWYSPLAAVPPARLEAVVEHAVRRAVALGRRERARRQELADTGFMSWPAQAGPTTQEGDSA